MRKVAVIGAGQIGAMIADLLGYCGDYEITMIDKSAEQLGRLDTGARVNRRQLDIGDSQGLSDALRGQFAALSAVPFHATGKIAEVAATAGVHYLDLTEDVATTRRAKELAKERNDRIHPAIAALRLGSSRSSATIWPAISNSCTMCGCASARCPSFPRTRSTTI